MAGAVSTKSEQDKKPDQAGGHLQKRVHQSSLPGPRADVLELQDAAGNAAASQLLRPGIDGASPEVNGVPSIVRDVLQSTGQPLDPATRASMESRFDHDFSQVRVHTGTQAAESTRRLASCAYTVGRDIVLAKHQQALGPPAEQQLLTHELVHVLQDGNAGRRTSPANAPSHPSDPAEREASTVVQAMSLGFPAPPVRVSIPPGTIQRQQAAVEPAEQTEQQETQERRQILDDMVRGMDLSGELRKRIFDAMGAFSLGQLRRMQSAGVRFWGPDGLPPAVVELATVEPLTTPAHYIPGARLIQTRPDAKTANIRHELAHAWDHIRAMREPRRLEELSEKQKRAALERAPQWWSASRQPWDVRGRHLTVTQMYERYRERVPRRELAFDGPGTSKGHSLKSPQEFYAEGYNVFHSPSETSQAYLLHYAPELYHLLEVEAEKEGLTKPNRTKLEDLIEELQLP